MRRAAVVAGVAAVLLSACGQSSSPEERLAASTEATSSAGSAELSMEMTMDMAEGSSGMNLTIEGEGAMDLDAQRGRLSLRIPGMGSGMETIYDGDTIYTQMPAMLTGGEARWVRQESPGLSEGVGTTGGFGGDPTEMLDALQAVGGEIEELGSDEVRGDRVEGYEFTITAADLQGGQDVPDEIADLEVPTQAWLDSEDRLRRMVTEIDMDQVMDAAAGSGAEDGSGSQPEAAQAMSGTMTMTMEFWNFGASVDVQPPDESEVIDADELDSQMMESMPGMEGLTGQGPGAGQEAPATS